MDNARISRSLWEIILSCINFVLKTLLLDREQIDKLRF